MLLVAVVVLAKAHPPRQGGLLLRLKPVAYILSVCQVWKM
jgi:hypothetical protein